MARQFNGTSDLAASTAALNLSGTNVVTIAGWLWWDAFANDNRVAVELGSSFPVGGFYFIPNHSASSGVIVGARGNVGYAEGSFTRPSAAAWRHYMAVINKGASTNEAVAAYLDGVAQTLTRFNNADNTDNFASLTLTLMKQASLFSAGRMADWAIWTAALTQANATALAGGALSTSIPSGLFVSWRMKDAGTTEADAGGNGRTLTYTGTTVVADPPALPSGTTHQGSAALSASGSLTATAVRVPQASSALTATGTLGATAAAVTTASAALSASGALSAAAAPVRTASALLEASGTTTAAAVLVQPAAASVSSAGTLTATAVGVTSVSADLSGTGTVAADFTGRSFASASLSGSASMQAATDGSLQGSAVLSATTSGTVAAVVVAPGSATLTASSTLAGDATVVAGVSQGAADLTGRASLTAAGGVRSLARSALSGAGALTSAATVVSTLTGYPSKVWDGTAWTSRPLRVWDGSAWRPAKVWDGSAWTPTSP